MVVGGKPDWTAEEYHRSLLGGYGCVPDGVYTDNPERVGKLHRWLLVEALRFPRTRGDRPFGRNRRGIYWLVFLPGGRVGSVKHPSGIPTRGVFLRTWVEVLARMSLLSMEQNHIRRPLLFTDRTGPTQRLTKWLSAHRLLSRNQGSRRRTSIPTMWHRLSAGPDTKPTARQATAFATANAAAT